MPLFTPDTVPRLNPYRSLLSPGDNSCFDKGPLSSIILLTEKDGHKSETTLFISSLIICSIYQPFRAITVSCSMASYCQVLTKTFYCGGLAQGKTCSKIVLKDSWLRTTPFVWLNVVWGSSQRCCKITLAEFHLGQMVKNAAEKSIMQRIQSSRERQHPDGAALPSQTASH